MSLFGGLFASTSPQISSYVGDLGPAAEANIRATEAAGSSKSINQGDYDSTFASHIAANKAANPAPQITMATAVVQPITATQVNTVPVDAPDPNAFATDDWRKGDTDGNYFTFDQNGSDDDNAIASMSLVIPASTIVKGSTQTNLISNYSRFFLENVSEVEQEKYQIVETFTGYYAFFYGKRPPVYRYSGILLSDSIYRWNNDFKFVYENYFRGTRATELGAEVLIVYDGRQISGFPLGLSMQQDAINEKGMPFSIDMLVVEHKTLKFSDDIAGFLQGQQKKLAESRANLKNYLIQLNGYTGPTAAVLDGATNGQLPPSSVGSSVTEIAGKVTPVSQVASNP